MAAIITASVLLAMAISLSGCVLQGKPKTAAATPPAPKPVTAPAPAPAPPAPLSIPQTHAELPAPQPVSSEALATTEPAGEPVAPPPSAPKSPRKGSRAPAAQAPKPEVTPPPVTPAVAPPAEPERGPIQEIVPAEELKRLQQGADAKKREIRQRLSRLPRHRQSADEKALVDSIQSFVNLSDDAERIGDMRKAYELADRGLVLAQGLPNGR
ncbi:MAG TPA: hypothetical protein VGH38_12055 [Bryobacteraceae bacterium]